MKEAIPENLEQEELLPREYFVVSTEVGNVGVFNFSEPLKEKHIEELKKVFEIFDGFKEKSPLKTFKYIFLKNENSQTKLSTGEEMSGYANTQTGLLTVFLEGQKLTPHRIPEVSNFKGTLIHDLAHGFSPELFQSWQEKFGWVLTEDKDKWAKSIFYENNQQEKCINEYAKTSPQEDFCESVVAAIVAPQRLNPEKLEFFKENIFGNGEGNSKVKIEKREEINLPKFKDFKQEDIGIDLKI